jgi:hypothetical protein
MQDGPRSAVPERIGRRSAPLRRTVNYRVGLFVRVPEGLTDSIC